jgi:membrane protein DedA with SNARE-associated domain
LGLLCRISLNPESCILRSADSFYRRGRKLLLIAKFIPGINTMAPPLAGSMNMRFLQFIRLDLVGATLYIVGYFSVGFVFSGALEAITRGYQAFGRVLGWAVIALIVGYIAWQCWRWTKHGARMQLCERRRANDSARLDIALPMWPTNPPTLTEGASALQDGIGVVRRYLS